MKVSNICRINYEYQLSDMSPPFKETMYSNRVETIILDERISVIKKVDKLLVAVFEIITYSFEIKNICDHPIENVYFVDNLQREIRFIHNTVLINGKKHRCLDPNIGFSLNTLGVGEGVSISFKVVVLPETVYQCIENHGEVDYDYVYHINKNPVMVEVSSNEVISVVENRLFKQWTHNSEFHYPELKLTNETVRIQSVKISHLSTKLIKSTETYELLIIAKMTYEVTYENNCHKQRYIFKECEGVSTLVTVPEGIKYCDVLDVKAEIEDYQLQIINHHQIAITTQLLFNVY